MNRIESGRASRAQGGAISTKHGANTEAFTFARAKAASLRALTAEGLRGTVFLEGGLVPWVASGRDSGRLHGVVDLSVRLGDMPAVREWLVSEGLYERALDSIDLACNAARADFGAHAVIDGVPVSFCPYFFDEGVLIQRNAANERTEGFGALFEARIPGIVEGDFVETREVRGAGAVGFSTLEACRAAKAASGREKDVHDVEEIDRMGCDSARLARVEVAFERMSVACVAFDEPGGGSDAGVPSEAAHWAAGVLAAARRLPNEGSALLFRSCASACITGRGLLEHFRGARDASGGDLDAFFGLLGSAPGVSTDAVEPGRAWEMSYGSCTCPVVRAGLTRDPALCECSRQSIAFVLGELFPEERFVVLLGETILGGGGGCTFSISRAQP